MDKNVNVLFNKMDELPKYETDGYIDLEKVVIKSHKDLANVSSIFRNSKMETFRLIYVNRRNRIVGYESITSRMTDRVMVFKDKFGRPTNFAKNLYEIKDRMKRLKATGYYMIHNHPSGNAKASSNDVNMTEFFIDKLNGCKGHLVINGESYAWIEVDNKLNKVTNVENYLPINQEVNQQVAKEINESYDGSILNMTINSRHELIGVVSHIKNSKDYSIAILTDAKGKVRMVLDIPNKMFNQSVLNLNGYFKNVARTCGGTRVFIGTDNQECFDSLEDHIDYGTFKDAVYFENIDGDVRVKEGITEIKYGDLFDTGVERLGIFSFCDNKEDTKMENQEENIKKLRILYKQVGKDAKVIEIDDTLEAKQELVGGLIEVVPYDEDALLICNDEGKLLNMPPNVMFDYDFIAGDFFIVGDDYENAGFKSLSNDEIKRYSEDLNIRSFKYFSLDNKQNKNHEKNTHDKEVR